jgi:hypothetical protein
VRSIQLIRGITFAFGLDYSLANAWAPYAKKTIDLENKKLITAF